MDMQYVNEQNKTVYKTVETDVFKISPLVQVQG